METARTAWIAASGVMGAGSVGTIALNYDVADPLFSIGRMGLVMSLAVALAGVFMGRRQSIDDAFEAGYQAGFHRGQRAKPKLIKLPSVRDRESASHQ